MTDELYHLSRKGLRGPADGPVAHVPQTKPKNILTITPKRARYGPNKWLIKSYEGQNGQLKD